MSIFEKVHNEFYAGLNVLFVGRLGPFLSITRMWRSFSLSGKGSAIALCTFHEKLASDGFTFATVSFITGGWSSFRDDSWRTCRLARPSLEID